MPEQMKPFHGISDSLQDEASDTIQKIRSDVDQLIEEVDINRLTDRVEEFGRQNPLALALGALTVGVAAGLLMRRRSDSQSGSSELRQTGASSF